MEFENAIRTVFDGRRVLPGTPESIFPLLCPVREYDWIDGWSCDMVYSSSGVAELGCIFRHDAGWGVETWTASRYEPNTAIAFIRVLDGVWVVMLELTLVPVDPASTELRGRATVTALGPKGEEIIKTSSKGPFNDQFEGLFTTLDHFLRTGTPMRHPAT
jgi:hypothetical protein